MVLISRNGSCEGETSLSNFPDSKERDPSDEADKKDQDVARPEDSTESREVKTPLER